MHSINISFVKDTVSKDDETIHSYSFYSFPKVAKLIITIRPGENKDIRAIIDISLSVDSWKAKRNLSEVERTKIEQAVDMEVKIAMYQKWIDNKEWFTNALRLFVAEVNEKVLGYIVLSTRTPTYFATTDLKQLYMADIAVHRDVPGQGIGDAMIEWMKSAASKQDIEIIRAECSRGRLEEWYKKHGFIPVPYLGSAPDYPTDIHTMLEISKTAFGIPS